MVPYLLHISMGGLPLIMYSLPLILHLRSNFYYNLWSLLLSNALSEIQVYVQFIQLPSY